MSRSRVTHILRFMLLCRYDCNFSLRACAATALKDVTDYFTKEQGQVAVSKRTTETVPLITIKHSHHLRVFIFLYVFLIMFATLRTHYH